MKMSNIANQLVAVVATLLGFVAHDALRERDVAPATVIASAVNAPADTVVTRAIDLEGISADWMNDTPRAERAQQLSPAMPASDGTAAARPTGRAKNAQFADVRVNDARFASMNRSVDTRFLR